MKIKREFPRFALWDAEGMAAHLENMEANGWQFTGTDWLGRWEYQECLSRQVRWAVTYTPSRSSLRISSTEAEQDLEEICYDAGWRKIAALSKFHIYRNEDPDCTPLETDELTRLDTMERSLNTIIRNESLMYLLWGGLLLGMLIWLLFTKLPRTLTIPALPALVLFCIWLILTTLIRWVLYLRWRNAARDSAEAGCPPPPVRHWQVYNCCSLICGGLILLSVLHEGNLILYCYYTVIALGFWGFRWYLSNRMEDSKRADQYLRIALVVASLLLIAMNRFQTAALPSPKVDTIPLMAQDLVDTTCMDLQQFDINAGDSAIASYHDYWQPDNNSSFDLRYTIFDLRLPILEEVCREWFWEDFHAITDRWGQTPQSVAPAPWGADAVWRTNGPELYGWLIFYEGRIVYMAVPWDMTEAQIASAATVFAP